MQWLIENVNRVQYYLDREKNVWVVEEKKTKKVLGKDEDISVAFEKASKKDKK